ncbi:MAG: hypothetical protein IPM54_33195 [Polyangiaceae bacterium]|nr:hypothetical protein [Polyangiaceae bacterium]
MADSPKYAHLSDQIPPLPEIFRKGGWLPDATPITPETWYEFWCVAAIHGWFMVLTSPRLWARLRRIPPKAFLLKIVDVYLVYAKSSRRYSHNPQIRPPVDLALRAASVERLRSLLVDWEPPVVTPEIREAAMAAHLTEMGEPLAENWDGPEFEPKDAPLEAMLPWPEGGEWDEEAFLAGRMNEEGNQPK